jgi:hypothetical protein
MADDKQSGSGVWGSSLVLLIIAAAGAVYVAWQNPSLTGSPPAALPGASDEPVRAERFATAS